MNLEILQGDWIDRLRELPDQSIQCCVTSPPYWGLRDYGVSGQLGLEKTPDEYVTKVVSGFREVWRVLRDDGTVWINLGDTYCGGGNNRGNNSPLSDKQSSNRGATGQVGNMRRGSARADGIVTESSPRNRDGAGYVVGLKPKDLVGIPWRVAFALQADGWYLRSDIIWHKPNPMPESVTDRPTKSHEYIFLLSKQERYFYDAEAIREPQSESTFDRFANGNTPRKTNPKSRSSATGVLANSDYKDSTPDAILPDGCRNKRTVWTVPIAPYSEAHFATFPPDLIKPCILAGSRPGDTILDPFFGSGTTGQVALELGRKCIGIELNPKYIQLANDRCNVTPGLALTTAPPPPHHANP